MTATLKAVLPSIVPEVNGVFAAVSDAQWSAGFDAGYRRAVNDLLAELALAVAEVGREQPSARHVLRSVRQRLELHVDTQAERAPADDYVDGGLGI